MAPTVLLLLPEVPSEEMIQRVREAAPDFNVESRPHGSDIPDELWAQVEVLYTFVQLPTREQAPGLRWVQLHSAGAEAVADNPLFTRDHVRLTNISGVHAAVIPEYVFTMLLAWGHRFPALMEWRKRGTWDLGVPEETLMPEELYGQTLGIAGYGSIGRQAARIGKAFGMRVWAMQRNADHHDRGYTLPDLGDPDGSLPDAYFTPEQLHQLLAGSDVVLLALPATPATDGLINAAALAAMKRTALLVNVGRGSVVDEPALVSALQQRRLGGAILDVFQDEPLPDDSPLWQLPNVMLTPHMSGISRHYLERGITLFADNLRRYRSGSELLNEVDPRRGY